MVNLVQPRWQLVWTRHGGSEKLPPAPIRDFQLIYREAASMTRSFTISLRPPGCRRLLGLLLLCACCFSGGCTWDWGKLKGEGFNDEMSGWSQNLRRQEKSDGTPLGTSNKALEIERNLGYR